jgi:starvation-inducible DNA-binding protein
MKTKIVAMKKKPIKVIEALTHLLADTYSVYLKTQNFHWNVLGPNFPALHQLFETQYKELAEAIDVIAERVRALRAKAPASFSEYQKLTVIKESHGYPDAEKMLLELLHDHEKMGKIIEEAFTIIEEYNDEVSLDLLVQRKEHHDKTAWMLRSTLGRS